MSGARASRYFVDRNGECKHSFVILSYNSQLSSEPPLRRALELALFVISLGKKHRARTRKARNAFDDWRLACDWRVASVKMRSTNEIPTKT